MVLGNLDLHSMHLNIELQLYSQIHHLETLLTINLLANLKIIGMLGTVQAFMLMLKQSHGIKTLIWTLTFQKNYQKLLNLTSMLLRESVQLLVTVWVAMGRLWLLHKTLASINQFLPLPQYARYPIQIHSSIEELCKPILLTTLKTHTSLTVLRLFNQLLLYLLG